MPKDCYGLKLVMIAETKADVVRIYGLKSLSELVHEVCNNTLHYQLPLHN